MYEAINAIMIMAKTEGFSFFSPTNINYAHATFTHTTTTSPTV